MDAAALEQKIMALAEPIVRSLGLYIWGLEIVPGPRTLVRLFVEAPRQEAPAEDPGEALAAAMAGIDECEKISRRLELALDAEDLLPGAWTLEVSTPGFSRRFFTIEQMSPYVGDVIEAKLAAPLEGCPGAPSLVRGILRHTGDDAFTLEPCAVSGDGDIIPENMPEATIPFNAARRVRRVHIFKTPQKPGGKKGPAAKKGR